MAINTGKVVTGGLLAGVVFNAFDMLWNYTVLAADMEAFARRVNLDPAIMTDFSYAIPWIVVDFLFGLLVVWNYAAIRPRFGPGPKTAIYAGLVPYFGVLLVMYGFTSMGVFTMDLWMKQAVLALITTVVGSVAGAWAYKE
ncbi:MAG: hypothetical protein ACRD96_05970 [Bryobacteraceae bacterium]